MALKFCANMTTMFKEFTSVGDKVAAVRSAGFSAVEMTIPYIEDAQILSTLLRQSDLRCILINSYPGNQGFAVTRSQKKEFEDKLQITLDYAKKLDCQRVHVLAGTLPDQSESSYYEARQCYIENIQYAADLFHKENLIVSIEAINTKTIANYFISSPDLALELIQEINRPNVDFQLDVFHLQMIEGCLTHNIKRLLPHTGYIQISQAPLRSEPGSLGEIDYQYVLGLLADYTGWIGLEYNPIGDTVDGFKYLQSVGIMK